jgi:hypothetical protein
VEEPLEEGEGPCELKRLETGIESYVTAGFRFDGRK